jgi:uracil-DNA glycosylase
MSQRPALSTPIAAKALAAWWEMAGVEPVDLDVYLRAAKAVQNKAEVSVSPPKQTITKAQTGKVRTPVDALAEAQRLARACTSIDALNKALASFEGCGLNAYARHCVMPDGILGAPVVIVGGAPDRHDDETGRAYSGANGVLLDKMLASIGLSRTKNCYILPALPWRPPGDRKPTDEEMAICRPFIARHIELAQPKALMLLGGVPAQMLLNSTDSIMKLRTRRFEYAGQAPIYAQCLLTPAYLRDRPREKSLAWTDLLRFEAEISALGVALSR